MNDYVVEKRLGQGAFGIAVLVRCKKDNLRYCIKEVNTAKMRPREREDARKEVAVIAQLDHPNIVRYCESFEEGGYLKIVMEYCDGGDLYSKIGNQRGVLFSEDQVLDWFVQICLALKHMHDRKILHRDLKSQNIFMLSTGKLKLGDFGIAKVLNSTMELARTAIGTPYYLSPEICEGRAYNNKSDIWSLGCVLYEMATLKHAFEAGNLKNLAMKIIRGTYPPISPMYSYELRTLVSQIFKRNPRERPGINAILRKPLLSRRIDKFLTEGQRQSEFCHTVMHGKKIAKVLPKPSPSPIPAGARAPRPLPPNPLMPAGVKRPSPGAAEPSKARRYDPAAVYGAGLKRAVPSPRPNVSPAPRPVASPVARAAPSPRPAAGRPSTPQQKRLEEQQKVAKQYKEMMERQRKESLNKAREQGWRNVLSSESNSSQDTPKRVESPKAAANCVGDYAAHHEALDRMHQEREERQAQLDRQPAAYMEVGPSPSPGPAREVAQAAEAAQVRGAEAAEKARRVEEFLARKREAANNRNRGLGAPYTPIGGPGAARPSENKAQEDYLERLRQIRMQNFRDRRNMHENLMDGAGVAGALGGGGGNADAIRREKIEKLKQQAEERASRLKEQLEQRRREAMNKEKERLRAMRKEVVENRGAAAASPSPGPVLFPKKAEPAPEPSPSPGPILFPKKSEAEPAPVAALQKGPSITAVMQQLQPTESLEDETRKKKDNILKRLNAKKAQEQQEVRGHWDEAPMGGANLAQMTLEATASQMEASGDVQEAQRRQWGGGDSVVNVLAQAEILATTVHVPSSEGTEQPPEKQSGTNLTRKGTFVIKKPPSTADKPPDAQAAPSVEPKEATAKPADGAIGTTLPLEKPTLENVELPEAPRSPAPLKTALSPELSMVAEETGEFTVTTDKKEENVLATEKKEENILAAEKKEENVSAAEKKEEDVLATEKKEEVSDAEIDRLANAALKNSGDDAGPKLMPQEGPLRGKWQSPPAVIKCEGEGAFFEKSAATKSEASVKEESMAVEDMEADTPRAAAKEEKKEEEKEEEPKKTSEEDAKSASGGSSADDEDMELLHQSYQDVLESVDDAERAASDKEEKKEEEEKEEEEEEEEEGKRAKCHAKTTKDADELRLCLTLGKFDMASAAKLRTCSLPDLTQLFEAEGEAAPLQAYRKRAMSADLAEDSEEHMSEDYELEERKSAKEEEEEKKEEEKEEKEAKKDSEKSEENGEEKEEEEEEEEEDVGEDDEDDMLESVRESMLTVLDLDSSSSMTDDTAGASNDNEVFESVEDDEEEDEDETTCSGEWDDGDGEEDEEFGDDPEEGGGDIFLRLERMREELEEAIGGTLLLKAYNVVQALQEDEDETVTNCQKALLPILGEEKMPYYDRIVQLVLADGVFMED